MSGWWWVVAVIAAGALVDRVLLAAERRGWIYWRRRGPSSGAAGNALLSFGAIFEPGKRHVVEEQQRQEADIDIAGDDEPLAP